MITDNAQQLVETAQSLFSEFNANPDEDNNFFQAMIDEFGKDLNLSNQLKQFHAWCLDQHPNKIKNCRFRFRSWVVNANNYNAKKQINGTPYPPPKKPLQPNRNS